jgi:glycosyltransferase involved in cell wall biosynthesis
MATSLIVHRPTWRLVDRYIAISQVVADFLISTGIPSERITVRHNVVPDPGSARPLGTGFLFAARLRAEKGINVLLDAWKRATLRHHGHLVILGDGPDRAVVSRAAAEDSRIEWRGNVALEEVGRLMSEAAVVVAPSLFDEPFGLTVVEALANGRPVIVGNRGAPASYLSPDAGWVVNVDPASLAAALEEADTAPLPERSAAARRCYEANFSPDVALRRLLDIYESTLRDRRAAPLR